MAYFLLFEPNNTEITNAAKRPLNEAIPYYHTNKPVIVQIDGTMTAVVQKIIRSR